MPFPSTPAIDYFNRAAEYPLSDGGRWTHSAGSLLYTDGTHCRADDGAADSWVYRNDLGPIVDSESWGGVGQAPGYSIGYFAFYLRLQGASLAAPNGYVLNVRIRNHSPTLDEWRFYRFDGGALAPIGTNVFGPNVAPGDTIGARMEGSTLTAWHNGVLINSVTSTTYPGAGRVGFGQQGDSTGLPLLDVVGGGALIVKTAPELPRVLLDTTYAPLVSRVRVVGRR